MTPKNCNLTPTEWAAAAELRRRPAPVPGKERSAEQTPPDVHESAISRVSGWFLVPPRG